MRVIQLVDSLEAGGTERMAVNLANALTTRVEVSALCTTRAEGPLKARVSTQVMYLFLDKRSVLDMRAWKRLYNFLKRHRIDLIHAHSSSYALAIMMKWLLPELKIVWHDHYGESEHLEQRSLQPLKFLSCNFSGSIAVNTTLRTWHQDVLNLSEVLLLSNFVSLAEEGAKETVLNGTEGKRIVCLANWRPQKDLLNLLKVFELLYEHHPEWSLHLVGKQFQNHYEIQIRSEIKGMEARNAVHVYGSVTDINHVLAQASIGILSSRSEGLPLSLLEYGQAALPVVVTDVGDCGQVVVDEQSGRLVPAEDSTSLLKALLQLLEQPEKATLYARNLNKTVKEQFSEAACMDSLLSFYKRLQVP